jgi:hypothetical protein
LINSDTLPAVALDFDGRRETLPKHSQKSTLMATTWKNNPLDNKMEEASSMWDSSSVLDAFPVSDKSQVKTSKIPPFEYKPSEVHSKHHALSVEVNMRRTVFVTNGCVEGTLELDVTKDNACKIGQISVYVVGYEGILTFNLEILSSGHAAPATQRVFLCKKLLLQHKEGVPSDAVFAGFSDEHGMWKARGGRTICDFSIPFAETEDQLIRTEVTTSPLPSSYWSKRVGGIRYLLAAVVESKISSEPCTPLAAYRELYVVESVHYSMDNEFANIIPHTSPLTIETSESVKQGMFGLGKKGIVKLSASIRVPSTQVNESGVWLSGNFGFVGVGEFCLT